MEERKKVRKRSLREDWKLFSRGLGIWWQICPKVLVYASLHAVAGIVAPYFPLYLSALLVNELTGACRPDRLFVLAAVAAAGQFGISIFTRFLQGRDNIWRANGFHQMELYMMKQTNRLQYRHLEDAQVTLLREKIFAYSNAYGAGLMRIFWSLPDLIGNLSGLCISLGVTLSMFRVIRLPGLAGFLGFMNSHMLTVLFFLLLAGNAMLTARLSVRQVREALGAMEGLARNNTLLMAMMDIYGEDVTIFHMKKAVLGEWKKRMLHPAWAVEREKITVRYELCITLLKGILEGIVFLITAAKAFLGVFGIGNFLFYRRSVFWFATSVADLAKNLSSLRENNTYLELLYQFLDLPDTMYHGSLAVEKRDDIDYEITFQDVSFRYPGTDQWALRHVDMQFRIGDKLAIVGENGSGKTTFIKLLCRLYDPTEGKILLNGIDITRYRYDEYIALFSVVFQDYTLFQFSLAANVAGTFRYDSEKVESCLVKAGLGEKLCSLDRGVETVIGRDYENDGIDLSGGEEQKVALARALYKDAPFVVLDEPTAALDPLAEAAVYENFRELTREKTAVFISHRLSSCRFCDDILVFEKGRLVQRGNHETLLGQEGRYRQLWEAQAKYYTNGRG